MFAPGRDDVRRFFCETWRKRGAGELLTPIEAMALEWIDRHPEYHADLASVDEALAADYPPEAGRSNPFLHLSMHLAIDEQLSIDQPPGIRAAFDALAARTGSAHDAAHAAMECLGETLWEAQRNGTPPSNERYLGCLRARAGLAPRSDPAS
jgi:hypothetical protein